MVDGHKCKFKYKGMVSELPLRIKSNYYSYKQKEPAVTASSFFCKGFTLVLRWMRDSNPHRLAPGGFQDRCNTNYANPPSFFQDYKYPDFFLIYKIFFDNVLLLSCKNMTIPPPFGQKMSYKLKIVIVQDNKSFVILNRSAGASSSACGTSSQGGRYYVMRPPWE